MSKTHSKNGWRKPDRRVASQIPYAQRLQIQKRCEINAERDAGGTRMLMAMLEAMHDVGGYGFQRLIRYRKHVMELIQEFYSDREIKEDHLRRRLASLGIELERYAVSAPASRQAEDVLQAESQDAAMVAMLVGIVAANDDGGFGADRLTRLTERTAQILHECAESTEGLREHEDKLRKLGFLVADGKVLTLLDDSGGIVKAREGKQ